MDNNDDDGSTDSIAQLDKPPKQKDKTKSQSKPNSESEHEYSSTSDNPYSEYQYEFPYQYPFNFFNMQPTSNSATESTKKTKKKSSSSANNAKKSAKEPDKTIVPFISISVGQHQAKGDVAKGDVDSPTTQNDSTGEATSQTTFSPDQKPSPNQAAYFNYLNTYSPSHNLYENQANPYRDTAGESNVQSANNYHQINPFSNGYPPHYGFSIPSNVGNAFGYGYLPFNGYNRNVRMPFFNIEPIGSADNSEHFEQNAKSQDSKRSI